MKTYSSLLPLRAAGALLLAVVCSLNAQEPPPPAPKSDAPPAAPAPDAPAASTAPSAPAGADAAAAPTPPVEAERTPATPEPGLRRIDGTETSTSTTTSGSTTTTTTTTNRRRHGGGGDIPFGDHHVGKGNRVSDAVSVFGSTSVDGEVDGDVVSVLGTTRIGPEAKVAGAAVAVLGELNVEGRVGDEAVGVLGGVKINNRVGGDVVSVLGGLELGPKADIGGDVVVVGGKVQRHADAVVRGNVVNVPILGGFGDLDWLVTWFKRCLLLGRPLAFGEHLGWAWAIAFSFLALYLLLALIFPRGIEKCAITLETRPGSSILASILTVFLTPVAIVLLAVTVIGAVLVPFVGIGLIAAKLFGKAVMLAWLGRRFTRFFGDGPLGHPVFAVLVGGVLVLLLYTVPFFGFLLYKLLSWLGLGVVVYTIALAMKREKPAPTVPPAGAGPTDPMTSTMPPPTGVPVAASEMPAAPAVPVASVVPAPAAFGASSGFAGYESQPGQAAAAAAAATAGGLPLPPRPSRPHISAATMPRATFMIRMAALLLDVVLVGMIVAFINGMMPRMFRPEPPSILLLLAIYGAVMWKLRGTTIGGIVCGLKVVRVDDRPVDWATSAVRALSCFLSLVVAGLGFIWIAIDDEKQSWHDKIAGTVVVRVPKGVSLL